MNNKIGALVIDLEGVSLSKEEAELLQHPLIGGVIFFARNYESRSQLKHLCDSVRKSRKKPLLLMVDQEGGRVQRFREGFYTLPSCGHFGKWYDKDPATAVKLAQTCGWLMASEVLAMGIDFSIAPVLDLDKGLNTVIGDRAFHSDPEIVFKLASAYADGMHEAGMPVTGKHFPGHGSVSVDSHLSMPIDDRDYDAILAEDLQPFINMIQGKLDAILASHILYPKVDEIQAGFSRHWLQDILRDKLKFKGVILTDDLHMQGANISANYADRVNAAREAGCDFALVCNSRSGVIEVIDGLDAGKHQVDAAKWTTLQAKQQPKPEASSTKAMQSAISLLNEYAQV